MISGATSRFPNASQGLQIMYGHHLPEDVVSSSLDATAAANAAVGPETHSNSLVYSLSVLKERVHQVQSMVTILISPHQSHHHTAAADSTAIAIATMGTLIQEIIITASSMMFTCQQISLGSAASGPNPGGAAATAATATVASDELQNRRVKLPDGGGPPQGLYSSETLDHWYGDNFNSSCDGNGKESDNHRSDVGFGNNCETHEGGGSEGLSAKNYDVIELDAADLLAKYTHYCQVCGKGFKRDANLRMHMRAHGDEYKSSAALINPLKSSNGNKDGGGSGGDGTKRPRKYSCPQEGCRWNRKHAKFQPLKSMICVKNHYKRSHCPKMYVCKRCNRKQFSVLSDLRTHEKHCGDLRWQCSCGTTFSRKDKLMGHVTLFVGHSPAIKSLVKVGKVEGDQMQ